MKSGDCSAECANELMQIIRIGGIGFLILYPLYKSKVLFHSINPAQLPYSYFKHLPGQGID